MRFWTRHNGSLIARLLGLSVASFVLSNCTTDNVASRADRRHATVTSRVIATGEVTPKHQDKVRKRVRVAKAAREHPEQKAVEYTAVGTASWYGEDFHGRRTANGETFDMNSFSAAHPSLPLPSNVRITNLGNHRSVVVRVNDRGPFVGGRVIDVSAKTAKVLGFYGDGLSKVKVEYVGRAQ